MTDTKMGTILIKEGTLLPEGLQLETEPCAPGWSFVKNLDGAGVDQKIHEAGWTFFCLAGEIKATVFGFDEQKTIRRAVERILANLKPEQFNSLEIIRVSSVASERFLGVRYMTVHAHSRHIQESASLPQAKSLAERDRTDLTAAETKGIGLSRGKGVSLEGATIQPNAAMISNS